MRWRRLWDFLLSIQEVGQTRGEEARRLRSMSEAARQEDESRSEAMRGYLEMVVKRREGKLTGDEFDAGITERRPILGKKASRRRDED